MASDNIKYTNILVITLRKIGDTIIATAGINLLKKAYPNAKITVMVKPLTKQIVDNHPLIDEVMLYNYTHQSKWSEIKQTVQKIKRCKFDLCIVLDNKPRSALLAWLAGIPKRVGFEKITHRNWYLKLLYTDIIPIDYDSMQTQQAKNHEIFINRFTGRNDKARMVMPQVSTSGQAKVDNLLQTVSHAGVKKVALCLRSGCLVKDWPLEYFQQTVEKLAQSYPVCFYIIGLKADKSIAEQFREQTAADIANFAGQTTLPELGLLLQAADLFITVDTGSAHIGGAVGVPMVVMYGSTSPKRWGPYADNVINIEPNIACHPCDGTKKRCNNPRCLSQIDLKSVEDECKKILEGCL